MPLIAENYIDLRPDSYLLDVNFNGYRLSLDTYPSSSAPLPHKLNVAKANYSQYGFEHAKLFMEINYLNYDPYYSNQTVDVFYVIFTEDTLQSHLYSVVFKRKEKAFSYENLIKLSTEKCDSIADEIYPATICLIDANFAVVSNGFGQLSLYGINENSNATERNWNICFDVQPVSEETCSTFIVIDGKRVGDRISVLLRTIIPKEKDCGKTVFSNRIYWLSLVIENGIWRIGGLRKLICEGHLELATLDSKDEYLIVASCGEVSFEDCYSHSELNKKCERPVDEMHEENAAPKKQYVWTQTVEDVTVVFRIGDDVKKSDITLSLSPSSIHLSISGCILLGGNLGGRIDSAESSFTIEKNRLELTLFKAVEFVEWKSVVVGNGEGIYEAERSAFQNTQERLEQFISNTLELGDSCPSFNTDQLEECDISEENICKLRWISGDSCSLRRESDITGNTILFTCGKKNEPRSFCLRMDVDGVLWSFSEDERKPIYHRATFNAFGYIQASKSERKFSSCSADYSYAVIAETKRHIYIYWQPTSITSDLRNRHTGQKVNDVSKQNLITLAKDEEFGEKAVVTDDIVGIHTSDVLYVLTVNDIFAIMLKWQPFSGT